ncbi:RFX DNA-binding domain-domain-containing protein [Protomyces lactucae-debilis]|uniref:RFX DNA-binding domain-domain-containing protein n=1 Tax=Protomyces lactucae-debilis TaxID=2754530 RepID=A0A1Y2FS10_PROLT|nr:RFX DNA-binding domain-containing protein [Protomyces lactucae-debilis]ORY86778.1 RFX DNA-binding domain-domain-containing protein [Protomyces lactucae-debilis]
MTTSKMTQRSMSKSKRLPVALIRSIWTRWQKIYEHESADPMQRGIVLHMHTSGSRLQPFPDVAVPRNKIYAAYTEFCTTRRLKPLTSANFGRIMQHIYPEVKTRRLGVRGESRYHYCGLRLVGDTSEERTTNPVSFRKNKQQQRHKTPAQRDPFRFGPTSGNLMSSLEREMGLSSENDQPRDVPGSVDFSGLQRPTTRLVYPTPELAQELDEHPPFELPQIYDYLPDDADADVQEALVTSYAVHCIDLIEAIASMKIRHFISLTTTFYQSLTEDVQALLSTASLATWVQKADLQCYQHMTRILSPLTTQVIPPEIFLLLRNLAATLLPNIHRALANHAPHLLQAKLVPAGQFSSLLTRLLRVNETAHAAARFLTSQADRELMRMDWIRHVDPKAIANRELSCGEDEVVKILNEVLVLLGPNPRPGEQGLLSPTPHSDGRNNHHAQEYQPVLELWQRFLSALPLRFPTIEPRLFLLCMGSVESAVLREVTVSGGEGFGALWVVTCWVDEMMRFLCERGGFLLEQIYDNFDDDEDLDMEDFLFGNDGLVGSAAMADASFSLEEPNTTSSWTQ